MAAAVRARDLRANHPVRGVGLLVDRILAGRSHLVEPRQLVVRQLDRRRGDVLLEVAPPLRARDRDDVVTLRLHPRERELRRRDALLGRNLLDPLDELEVALEVTGLEARIAPPEVVLRQIVRRAKATTQEAAAERAVRDEADPKLAHSRKDLVLGVTRPERVLRL